MRARRADDFRAALRASAPAALAVLLAMLTMLPLGSGTAGFLAPHVTLMMVFYFSIHRPGLMPPVTVAALGLIQDLLWGGPPGLNMLVLLIAQLVLSNQQTLFTRRSFAFGWVGFGAVAFIALAVSWILASGYYGRPLSPWPLVMHGLVTIASYPLFGWLFGQLDKRIADTG